MLLHGYKHLKSTTSAKTVNEHDKHNPTWRDQRNLATNKRKYDEVMNEPEKTYLCKFCDKSFKQRGYLKIHMTIHTGEKPFSCDYCGLRFRLKSTMDKHRRLHTGERPFVCDVCKKTFVQDGDLIVHKRLHSGERPFSCKFCEKKFPSNSNMTKHMKSAHMFKKKPKGCIVHCPSKFNFFYSVDPYFPLFIPFFHFPYNILHCKIVIFLLIFH